MTTTFALDLIFSAKHREIPPRAKYVFLSLVDLSQDNLMCSPTVAQISKHCNLSGRTIQRAMADLVSAGLISKDFQYRKDKGFAPNIYKLTCQGGVYSDKECSSRYNTQH